MNNIQSIKEKFADKRYTSCWVVYDFVLNKYIKVNDGTTIDVGQARAFDYSEAQDYICSRMLPQFLEVKKYTPDTDEDITIPPFDVDPNPVDKNLEDRFMAIGGK